MLSAILVEAAFRWVSNQTSKTEKKMDAKDV